MDSAIEDGQEIGWNVGKVEIDELYWGETVLWILVLPVCGSLRVFGV